MIVEWAKLKGSGFTITMAMREALKLESYQMTRAHESRIAQILREHGYDKQRARTGTDRAYLWRKPGAVVQMQRPAQQRIPD
jgi:hypothetical protein